MSGWPKLLAKPEYCPGCYDLHMYCKYENPDHEWNEFPHQFGEGCETGGQARAIARQWGWIIHRDGTGTCPKCAKALARHPKLTSGGI